MIVELLTIGSILFGGSVAMRILGIRGWGLPFLGFVTGMGIYIAIGTLQVVTPISTSPIATIIATVTIPGALWAAMAVRGHDVGVRWPFFLLTAAIAAALVVALRTINFVAWSQDSLDYMGIGGLIAGDNYDNTTTGPHPEKRLIGAGILHASASFNHELYLRSITPLVALAIVGLIAWFATTSLRNTLPTRALNWSIFAGLAMLVFINRFTFHAFYVNGHLFFAALLLAVVGCSLLIAMDRGPRSSSLVAIIVLVIPAIVVMRAEGPIVVGIALLPLLVSPLINFRDKAAILASLALPLIAWQSFLISTYVVGGEEVPLAAMGLLACGVVLLALIPLARFDFVNRRGPLLLVLAEVALWSALVVMSLRDPQIIAESATATFENLVLGASGWGLSLLILFALMIASLIFMQVKGQLYIRFVITTFLPLGFLLAYLREAAYRTGDGDSLNRMWIQIVPLIILFLTMVIANGNWRFARNANLEDMPASTPRSAPDRKA